MTCSTTKCWYCGKPAVAWVQWATIRRPKGAYVCTDHRVQVRQAENSAGRQLVKDETIDPPKWPSLDKMLADLWEAGWCTADPRNLPPNSVPWTETDVQRQYASLLVNEVREERKVNEGVVA